MSIRWGDSDSSGDEGPPISASSLTRMHEERQQMDLFAPSNEASPVPSKWILRQPAATPEGGKGAGQSQKGGVGGKNVQHGAGAGGGRGKGGRRSGGGGGGGLPQQQSGGSKGRGGGGGRGGSDWKQMAKASSKFGQDADINLDGGSWMAQRRAKQQQQEEEHKKIQAMEKEKQQEEKRQRRKSQMEALKAAVQTIEETQPPVSSLQAAAAIHKPPQSPQPTKILKRHDKDELDNESVTSFTSQSSGRSGRSGRASRKDGRAKAHEGGRGPGRGNNDRRGSERSFEASGLGGRGRDRRPNDDVGGVHADSTSHSSGGRGGRGGGRGRTGGRGRSNDDGRGSGRGKNDHAGRGRGSHTNKGKLEPGKPQVVRTSSGTVEYHIDADANKPKTEAKLLPNGTVRLSKKNKGGKQHGNTKTPTRSPIRTRLEIGAEGNKTT